MLFGTLVDFCSFTFLLLICSVGMAGHFFRKWDDDGQVKEAASKGVAGLIDRWTK